MTDDHDTEQASRLFSEPEMKVLARHKLTPDEVRSTQLAVVRVADVSGPSYAGHGPWATDPLHVLRLGICNLACEWCEAPETVAFLGADLDTTAPYITVDALLERVLAQLDTAPDVPLLITGGEPLLQDWAVLELAQRIANEREAAELWVETNGTKPPPEWWAEHVDRTLVSPKVGTRDPQRKRLPAHALTGWAELANDHQLQHLNRDGGPVVAFDFCCATRSDVLHAVEVCTWLGLYIPAVSITPRVIAVEPGAWYGQQLAVAAVHDTALEHGFCLTPRPLVES